MMTSPAMERQEWRERVAAHEQRWDLLTADRRERAARGVADPVEDFIWTYYGVRPAALRRWHPGPRLELLDAEGTGRETWRWYVAGANPGSLVVSDAVARADKSALLEHIETMLRRVGDRAPQFGCFGMHEWAMVYRQEHHRHPVPLRLGQAGTDTVVESHELRCTHYDAFRFFTEAAEPLNLVRPTRELQPELDQPGCLHVGMDLFKWALKLGPLLPGEILLDAFELARDIRVLDMAASPYDLRDRGYAPVAVETPEGKVGYVRQQRAFNERAAVLRSAMLSAWLGES